MADVKSPEHSLEVLPAMLNLVLIQTGKLLRDPESHNLRSIGLTRSKINEFVPGANDRFHDALDEIEFKILDAKAVMERDLSVMRKKRAQRLGIKPPPKAAPADAVADEPNAGQDQNGMIEADKDESGDMEMFDIFGDEGDDPLLVQEFATNELLSEQIPPENNITEVGLAEAAPQANLEVDETGLAEVKDAVESNTKNTNETGEAEANEAAQTADLDFESMFNDADLIGDDAMNFDFTTNSGNADLLMDGAFENVAGSGTELANTADNNNENIDSLLPGLDAYVNDSNAPVAAGPGNDAPDPQPNAPGSTAVPHLDSSAGQNQEKPDATGAQVEDTWGLDFGLDDNANVGDLGNFDFDEEWLKM